MVADKALSESAPVSILLVDDEEDNLWMMKEVLERPELVVLTATSAAGALALLDEHEVALAVLDVQMPDVNGFALAERMRGNERTRAVPIMFLTGATFDAGDAFRGYEAGAVDFLFKPVDHRVLESKVEVFVELYQQRRQLRERNAELERLLRLNQKMAADLRRAHGEAVQTSLTDELTGVANRRHILQLAHAAITDHRRKSQPLTLAILDLDNFKKINDTHGHSTGDAVLLRFCEHCRKQLRSEHELGRIGGEEFLLLLPGVGLEDARVAVERLRSTLEPHAGVRFTFSAGLTQGRPGEPLSEVMERADRALYRAKGLGRNRTVSSPS